MGTVGEQSSCSLLHADRGRPHPSAAGDRQLAPLCARRGRRATRSVARDAEAVLVLPPPVGAIGGGRRAQLPHRTQGRRVSGGGPVARRGSARGAPPVWRSRGNAALLPPAG